ncbi:hypothetical protein ACFYKX_10210 [Cytobacillus sp. FJAT-54145]|uniref:Uncharacterized protein n=1 Tax=Cytobacillus spartinae TaxID=3299023 RepID=A0ABW6K9W6_9BACI
MGAMVGVRPLDVTDFSSVQIEERCDEEAWRQLQAWKEEYRQGALSSMDNLHSE